MIMMVSRYGLVFCWLDTADGCLNKVYIGHNQPKIFNAYAMAFV